MIKRWINTKAEFIWDGSQYVEQSSEGYWYDGEMAMAVTHTTAVDITLDSGATATDFLTLQSSVAGGGTYPRIKFSTESGNSNVLGKIGFLDIGAYSAAFTVESQNSGSASTSTSEIFRIQPDGKVGMGETAPTAKLHVFTGDSGFAGALDTDYDELCLEGSGNVGMTILSPAGNTGAIVFGDNADKDMGRLKYDHVTNAMQFYANNIADTKMYLNSSNQLILLDKVGIGTSSPDVDLDVKSAYPHLSLTGTSNGWGRIGYYPNDMYLHMGARDDAYIFQIHNHSGGAKKLFIKDGYRLGMGADASGFNLNIQSSVYSGSARFANTYASGTTYGVIAQSEGASTTSKALYLYAVNATTNYAIHAEAGDVWIQAGNVGIGDSTPASKLEVKAASSQFMVRDDNDAQIFAVNNDNVMMCYETAGKVGIKTSSPVEHLHVGAGESSDSNTDGCILISADAGLHQYLRLTNGGGTSTHYPTGIWYQPSGRMELRAASGASTSNAAQLVLASDGKVGIGDSSPSYKLEVAGTFYASGSSQAFKKNVTDLAVDSSAIYNLNPVSYNYKKDFENFGYDLAEGKQFGLISEEVAEVIPEITIMKDGKAKNVDYQKLSVLLLAEMKKMNKRIEELECHIGHNPRTIS